MFYRRCRVVTSCTRGFTLIELVVTFGLLGLLAAGAAPSLEALRGQSKKALCLDRLRAIAQATATYGDDDPSGAALPVHGLQTQQDPANPTWIGAYEWGGKSGVGRPGFAGDPGGTLGFLTSRYGTQAGFGPASRPLNAILYPSGFRDNLNPAFDQVGASKDVALDLDAYQCPADDGPPLAAHCPDWLVNPGQSSFDHFGTSYAANIFMTASVGGGYASSNSPYLRPASEILSPARTILYEENIGRWAWACRREVCDFIQPGVDPGPLKALGGWHGKNWTYNHAYGDGHADTQALFEEGTEDAEGYSWHYRTELVFPDDPGMQSQFRCLIIRGDGWQKDTLPAPAIPTDLQWRGAGGRPSYEDCVDAG